MSGASFSIDARDFDSSARPPRVGLVVLALDPTAFASDYLERVEGHLDRLHSQYGIDFGRHTPEVQRLQLADDTYDRLLAAAARPDHLSEGDTRA